jgi:hypothetical protein
MSSRNHARNHECEAALETDYCCPPRAEQPILYVVFHGDFVFVDNHKAGARFIRVLAPQMDEHVYMAGPWLAERNIPMGTILELDPDSVKGTGQETIHHHTDQFLIFDSAPGNPEAQPHFEILLPRPDAILKSEIVTFDPSMVVIETPGVTFEAPDVSLDLRPVFQYYLPDPGSTPRPSLMIPEGYGNPAMSWIASESCPGYYSLHIFAETDRNFGPGHSRMAFHESAKLLGFAADLDIFQDGKTTGTGRIHGLHPDENGLALKDRVCILENLDSRIHLHVKARESLWINTGDCGPIGS